MLFMESILKWGNFVENICEMYKNAFDEKAAVVKNI